MLWRKISVVILLSVLCAGIAPAAGEAATMTIARDGKPLCTIVVAKDAILPERHAAKELAAFLKQITGGTFPIADRAPKGRGRLLVGPGAAKLADPGFSIKGLGSDGIVIRSVGKDLILAGGRTRGTLYAVYTFLEDTVGCRWWAPKVSTIPRKPTLDVPALNVRYVPFMEYRVVFFRGVADEDWGVRNKVTGGIHPPYSEERGGSFMHSNFCHTFPFLISPKKYFKQHPEWFSEINGRRVPNQQLCLTNEEMRLEMVKNLKDQLRRNPAIDFLWVSQNDTPRGYCQCKRCKAIDQREGSPSGNILRFVNAVAKEFPDRTITTLAYHYSEKPPKLTKARRNVNVWFCYPEANYTQPLDHPSNRSMYQYFKGWAKICSRLYCWEYISNFWAFQIPNPNWFSLGRNTKLMAQHGVKGVFAQGVGSGFYKTEMWELRGWLLAKLRWNPKLDDRKLIQEFLDGYYGPAGRHIYAYLKTLSYEARSKGFYVSYKCTPDGRHNKFGPNNPDKSLMAFPALAAAWGHLAAAEQAVKNRKELLTRVHEAKLPLMRLFSIRWNELQRAAGGRGMPMSKANLDGSINKIMKEVKITQLKE